MNATPDTWFHNAVVDGVQRLYALNLMDRPSAETVPLVAVTWVEVLWSWLPWTEQLDAWRLPVAFRHLAASAERWPAPKQLRAHLPARRQTQPALPPAAPSGPTEEQRARLAEVTERLRKRVGHSIGGKSTPLTRGTFPAAHEDAIEPARGSTGSLELS
ncbi:hypothetical protein ACG04Q_11980 [Roseateles sp. DXS20W]|uniref:DUF1376 domain-containing protein n=1 Tax=Pelomonas lactea TaxID=3299030 RepID=A0ABW7GK03_9BURK